VTGHQPQQALLEVLEAPLAKSGLDLEDVEMSSAGRRNLVRVFIDTESGITLDDIASATHLVSAVLDESDVMGDAPYTLEVTSPGIGRPLTLPRHWRRNIDRLVQVQLRDGDAFTGRVLEADDQRATLDVDGSKRAVVYPEVVKARVEIEFNRRSPKEPAERVEEEG